MPLLGPLVDNLLKKSLKRLNFRVNFNIFTSKVIFMDNVVILIGFICLFFLWWNLYVSTKIIGFLRNKGEDASLFRAGFFVKGRIFNYLPLYRRYTTEEEGRPGALYYLFYFTFFGFSFFYKIVAINLFVSNLFKLLSKN